MSNIWTRRSSLGVSAVALLSFALHPALAQKGNPSSSSPNTGNIGMSNPGSTTRGNPNNAPNSIPGTNSTTTGPYFNRPIFLSGKVMFDDGTPANPEIRIERVCSGSPHLEAHTDSKGHFSFQVGSNTAVDTEAADASSPGTFGQQNSPFGSSSSSRGMGSFGSMGRGADALWACELRAAYPGYRSDVVELGSRKSLDDPNVGTIVLHRLAHVQGTTISMTTALAPKHAQKEYEKGTQLAAKGKFDEAEKHLAQATDAYSKYAIAWFALGQVQQRENKTEDARKSFEAAIGADSKYVSPYDQLALMAAQGGHWDDAAAFSKQAIGLNPVEFPSSYWYNAIANYNLKKSAEAEKSAAELVKLDTKHQYPEAESMLAQISLEKGNYPDAATHLRAYLSLAPNAKNADALKQTLLKIEQANAETKK